MSALINRVKDHISDNRGKYGAAAGAGAMYGASKIDSPLVNQAGFNILANGQNLALDTAAKIDPRATTALNDLGMHKIRPEDIDASNALYNSGVAKYINPNPVDMVNANEHSTEAYNKAMAMKANAEDTLVNTKNQGQDYLDQGINYVKGLNPFSESTLPGKTMKLEIKQALLEGHTPEVIVEAVHANHPELSKSKTGTTLGYTRPQIQANRGDLAKSIKGSRRIRDDQRNNQNNTKIKKDEAEFHRKFANQMDNESRVKSQMGSENKNLFTKEQYEAPNILGKMFGKKRSFIGDKAKSELFENKPRSIASAKQ